MVIFESGVSRAIRLTAGTAQGVRHRGARVSLDFGTMAELAAARASGLAQQLQRRDLWIGVHSINVNGLFTSRGNIAQEHCENDEQ